MNQYFKFCLIIFFLIHLNLTGQNSTELFKYNVEYIENHTWEDKLEACLKNGKDSLDFEKVKKQIKEFQESKSSNTNKVKPQIWEYYYNGKIARIKGNNLFRSESFDIYEEKKNRRIIRRLHKGNENDLRIDTLKYNGKEKEFKVEIFQDSIKRINGYLCHLIKVDEINKRFSEPIITHYEIYVSEEIEFPMNPIIELPIKITDNCAIQIKSWANDEKRNVMLYELAEYRPEIKKDMFNVPKKYLKK